MQFIFFHIFFFSKEVTVRDASYIHFVYTCLRKGCRVKRVNDGQCDTMELWEDGKAKFVTGFRFLILKIFSFQDNFKSKLRHAELL